MNDETSRALRAARATLAAEADRLRREDARMARDLRPQGPPWLIIALALAACAVGAWLLAGCVSITVAVPPPPTPPPPPCPELTLVGVERTAEWEVVRLRAHNPGPGMVVVDQADVSFIGRDGQFWRAPSDTRQLRAGESVPITLRRPGGDRRWVNLARLDADLCPPVVVALPEPK